MSRQIIWFAFQQYNNWNAGDKKHVEHYIQTIINYVYKKYIKFYMQPLLTSRIIYISLLNLHATDIKIKNDVYID